MEVDADNRLRILYYNADADCLVGEPVIIDSIGRPEDFTFTKARAAASEAPRFEEEPTVVSLSSSSLVVGIPNAVCRDYVRNYRVDLFRDGKLEKTVYRLAAQDRLPGDVFITASFPGLLPEGEYLVNIYAYNAYGKMSDAVSLTVRTPAEAADPSPDVFRLDLLSGDGRDGIALSDLGTVGTPTVLYAAATGQNIAVFDGDDALAFPGLSTYTDLLSAGFSLEVTGKIASVPTEGEVAVVSAEAAGGFALTYRSDGKMYAKVYTKANSYLECGAAVFPGTAFHATVTYDGKTLRLYLDGEEAASAAKSKTTAVFFPLKENCRRLVIGGAPMSGGETRPSFRGTISAVNVYSMPLSADAVRAKAAAALS